MKQLDVSVSLRTVMRTNGIQYVRITGPHEVKDTFETRTTYKMGFWINGYPEPPSDAIPDFYIELDEASVVNMRNALSSVMLAAGVKM